MKYRPLTKNAEINFAAMLTQAVSTLEAAATVAESTQDVEGLLNTTAMFLKLADIVDGMVPLHVEEEDKKSITQIATGFQGQGIAADEEEEIND